MIGRNRSRQASRIAASGDKPSRSRVIAKSTSMMPFFFTMPISRMMPMMPITDRSKPPSPKRQQRADAGRRQRRQDRQRMDVALVEHAEDDIDDHQRRDDQDRLARERGLERLRVALEAADQRSSACRSRASARSIASTACPSATPGCRLNDKRHRRELPLMRDRERAGLAGVDVHQRRQRHRLPGARRLHVDLVERRRGSSAGPGSASSTMK